jgi:hypothetical protein
VLVLVESSDQRLGPHSFQIINKGTESVVVEYEWAKQGKGGYNAKVTSIIQIGKLVFDKTLKHVEVKESAPIRAAQDSPQVVKEEHTVKHSVGVQNGTKLEADARAKLWSIEAGIKGAIERSTSRTYEESKTSTREVTIPGNGRAYKVVWVETFRTGKAVTIINGTQHEVPFEFRDGWLLQTREVKESRK